jgi:hypothetical protein
MGLVFVFETFIEVHDAFVFEDEAFGLFTGSVRGVVVVFKGFGRRLFVEKVVLLGGFVAEQVGVNFAEVERFLIREGGDYFLGVFFSLLLGSFVLVGMEEEVRGEEEEFLVGELGLEGFEEVLEEVLFVDFRVDEIVGFEGDDLFSFLL